VKRAAINAIIALALGWGLMLVLVWLPVLSEAEGLGDTTHDDTISPVAIVIVTAIPTSTSKPYGPGPTAMNMPQPPPLLMILEGFVYVGGIRAEDGTLVEARIGGVTVASFNTITTEEGQNGYYVLSFQGAPGDEVHLFVEGVEANESPVEYEMGHHTLHLTVGEVEPATHTLTMTVIGSGQTDPPVGEHTYLEGSMVTIRAIADEGWQFDGWIGDVADPNEVVTWITMDSDKTVTASFTVAPTSIYVAPGGDCGEASPCYAHPQDAVDAASDDDVIKLAGGIYTGVNNYGGLAQVVYISKTVTIRGGYTTANWATSDPDANPTTLDARGQGRVLYITGDISPTIEGLRITGGDAAGLGGGPGPTADAGGGVYLNAAAAIISDSQVFSNTADWGGGLYLYQSDAVLSRNTVTTNTADYGGGMYLWRSDATLTTNTVAGNAAAEGGGLYLYQSDAVLSRNTVTTNTAVDDGGGLYLFGSAPTLTRNTVTANTADYGGGLRLDSSAASLSDNIVADNQAHTSGGGLYLLYGAPTLIGNIVTGSTAAWGGGLYLYQSDAMLSGNTVTANTADYGGGGIRVFFGAPTLTGNTIIANTATYGGGLHLRESEATLNGNKVSANTADYGGGLCLLDGAPTLIGNTVTGSTATWGGGLYLYQSDATLSGNTVTANTADYGGGLYLHESDATLDGNKVSGNSAEYGGGLYVLRSAAAILNRNIVWGNTAHSGGGGLYLHESDATLINTVVADNQTQASGSGLTILTGSPRLLHSTIARNTGGDGSGIYVASGSVALSNTILVSHTLGVYVASDTTATLESTLWWANYANWDGGGAVFNSGDHTGDPAFVAPDAGDYHIEWESAARDQGVNAGVTSDMDGHPRPIGAGFDLGADECTGLDLSPSRKMASPDQAGVGEVVTYTVALLNSGYLSAANTLLFDAIPTHTTYISGSAQATSGVLTDTDGIRWTGTLTPQQAVTITYCVTVTEKTFIENTAIVTDQYGTVTTLTAWVNARRMYLPLVLR
jgi:uncharacterized repeat protein (TIGR01451 family)